MTTPDNIDTEWLRELTRLALAVEDPPSAAQLRAIRSLADTAPSLLATVEAQRKEIERLRREGSPGVLHEVDQAFYDLTVKERDAARAEVEGLRREIALKNEGYAVEHTKRVELAHEVERLRADRLQFAERVAVAAMQDFIGRMRPNEPYGAADMSRGRCCIDAALRGEVQS